MNIRIMVRNAKINRRSRNQTDSRPEKPNHSRSTFIRVEAQHFCELVNRKSGCFRERKLQGTEINRSESEKSQENYKEVGKTKQVDINKTQFDFMAIRRNTEKKVHLEAVYRRGIQSKSRICTSRFYFKLGGRF